MYDGSAPAILLTEYAERRQRVLTSLGDSVGLLFAGERAAHSDGPWRPHQHFAYLTGITDEHGAALLLDPTHPVEVRRVMLFLRPLNPEMEKWDGYRIEISSRLREETGIKSIYRTNLLPRFLLHAAVRSKNLACLHPCAAHDQPLSPDLETFRKVAERVPGAAIEERSDLLPLMRSVKSEVEIRLIERAVEITAGGYEAVLQTLRPGISEFEVQETIEHTYKTSGSRGPLYGTIAGGGLNSTVLHYGANDQMLREGDLICIDSAASFGGYSADVTRTFPVSGRFSKRQREVYEIVLNAERAAIEAAKPGVSIAEIDKIARDLIEQAGYGDYFIHGIGHHLGLEVHDSTPIKDDKLSEGAVITIEPGIYIADEKIGVRIEDDILITKDGPRNLSESIPKVPDEIERIMASRNS